MASSYSTDLKLELMVTGENSGTWGDKTNTNWNVVQQAIAGYEAISIAGGAQTTALVMSNATISTARNAVVKLTGTITGNQIVTIPDGIEKIYIIENGTTGAFTVQFKTVSGTGPTFSTTDKGIKIVYSNATDIVDVNANLSGPTLASDLNVNGKSIISTSNGNIVLAPNGTGDVYLDADTVRVGDSGAAATLTTNGAGDLTINTNSGTNSGSVVLSQGTNGNISITPNGTGSVVLDGLNWPQADGTNGQVLQTNGSGQLSFATASSGASSLKSSITLKTAASITAGKLASINSSGQIVNLPTLNTYGTVRTNSSNTGGTSYTCTSLDGSTALSVVNSYSSPTMTATFYGSVISNSGTPTNGTTTTNTINTGGSYAGFSSMNTSIFPIGNNTFMVMQYLNGIDNRTCGVGTAFYASYFIITVDASTGNLTKGAVVTSNQTLLDNVGAFFYAGQVNKNILINYGAASTLLKNFIVTWSGTTVTITTDTTDVPFWYQANGFNSLLTSSNILCLGVPNSATWRTASWTASPPAIGTKTDTTAVGDYYDNGAWWKMDAYDATGASYVLFTYRNTSLNYVYNTFSINQTTGALTSVETGTSLTKLGSNTFSFSTFKNSSNQVYTSTSYPSSGNLNSVSWTNGVVNGFNANGYSTLPYSPIRLNSSDLYYLFSYNTSNFPTNQGYTVNAYSTDNFNYVGVVETTTSTSPASIVTDGVAANFTSLTPATVYYATSPYDGTVTTSTTSGILVGKAISSTQILLQRSNTQ
jgi:hypothetical protein